METLDKDTKYANKHKIQGRVLQKGRLMGIYGKLTRAKPGSGPKCRSVLLNESRSQDMETA